VNPQNKQNQWLIAAEKRIIAAKNAVMKRIIAARDAAKKHSAIKILVTVMLFLLASACASVINEIVQDLWEMTGSNREEMLKQLVDSF
jgi:hypothetical protein